MTLGDERDTPALRDHKARIERERRLGESTIDTERRLMSDDAYAAHMQAVLAPQTPGETRAACVFCRRIDAGQYDQRFGAAVTFEPLNPVTPGHRLFVPVEHAHPIDEPFQYAWQSTYPAQRALAAVLPLLFAWRGEHAQGEDYNIILNGGTAATQTIPHMHVHYVPRRPDDGLTLPWTGQKKPHPTPSPREDCAACEAPILPGQHFEVSPRGVKVHQDCSNPYGKVRP